MEYKFLAVWCQQIKLGNKRLKKMMRFEDQYALFFFKQKNFLQINLGNNGGFCFFTHKKQLPFKEDSSLNNFGDILKNAKPEKVIIEPHDRILRLQFSKIDIYNQLRTYYLFLELIPRYQNMILTDDEMKILECRKKISFAENTTRQILPGLKYEKPVTNFQVKDETVQFPLAFNDKLKIEESNPEGEKDIDSLFEDLYYKGILAKRNQHLKQQKIKQIRRQIKKKKKKLKKQQQELQTASKQKKWKQIAELLNANFAKIKSGADSITLKNYYEDDFSKIQIPLQAEMTPRQNVERYFKKYRKARDGKKKIVAQISKTEQEISHLQQQIEEVEATDFMLQQEKSSCKKQQKRSYKRIVLADSWQIYVGRSSNENDFITTSLAQPHDWWFHTRIFKGTHVVLRNLKKQELPEQLKFVCCQLAAYFSKAKKSKNVPVDYTQIRYVRKPKGSPPGFVIYDKQKTLYVDPLSFRDAVQKLQKERSKHE
jgi:predicted ribosome quality control (RQC) complex YloA/Tae2 family protein